jgi:hypothetical protein
VNALEFSNSPRECLTHLPDSSLNHDRLLVPTSSAPLLRFEALQASRQQSASS